VLLFLTATGGAKAGTMFAPAKAGAKMAISFGPMKTYPKPALAEPRPAPAKKLPISPEGE
jgi:hypothetical protein